MIEILAKAMEALVSALGAESGAWIAVGGFFAGMMVLTPSPL